MNITTLMHNTVYAVILFTVIYVAKKIFDALTHFDECYQIQEESNLALAFRQGGLYLAMAIALMGALSGKSAGFAQDIKTLLIDSGILIAVLIVACKINDHLILRGIDNDKAIESKNSHKNAANYDPKGVVKHGNIAVGIVEFGSLVATGFVMSGAFSGEGGGMLSFIAFAILGQIALVLMALVYQKVVHFNVLAEIKAGNASAGIALAGMLIALGVILRASIAGNFVSWSADLVNFGTSLGFGMVLLIAANSAVSKVFLSGTSLTQEVVKDRNPAALTLTYSIVVALALIISTVV